MRLNLRLIVALGAAFFAGGLAPGSARADDITLTPRVIPVGKWAEGVVYAGGSLWVSESGQQDIAQIDVNRGAVTRRITVGRLPVGMTVASDGAVYALVQTDRLVWQQYPNQSQGKSLTGLDGCPDGIDTDGHYLWVMTEPKCSSENSKLIRIDMGNWSRAETQTLNQWDQALLARQGKVWVAHARSPVLTMVDQQTLGVSTADLQGASLWAISGCCGVLHVGGRIGDDNNQGIVASVDPNTLQERRRQLINQRIAVITEDQNNVVAIGEKGAIWIFSQSTLDFQRLVTLPGGKFEPRAATIVGDDLYISQGQRQGENGAVLVVSGWRPPIPPGPATPVPAVGPAKPPTPTPAAAPTPAPQPAPAATPAPSTILSTNCPFHIVNVTDELWMYLNADATAPRVIAIPAGARGLTADRCVSGWCHVTFGNSTGWVQSQYLQPDCN